MKKLLRILLLTMALSPPGAFAVEPSEILSDPKLEARARALSANLRCLVCQNQSIDDSNAPLAKDLRVIVRERLSAGDSDAQAMEFLVNRYGDFILLSPPVKAGTILLWTAPFGVLTLGALFIFLATRRRKAGAVAAAPLQRDELAKLSAILDKNPPQS